LDINLNLIYKDINYGRQLYRSKRKLEEKYKDSRKQKCLNKFIHLKSIVSKNDEIDMFGFNQLKFRLKKIKK